MKEGILLIALINTANSGDVDHTRGVMNVLYGRLEPNYNIEKIEMDVKDKEAKSFSNELESNDFFISKYKNFNKVVTYAAGETSLNHLIEFKDKFPKTHIIFGAHQFFKSLISSNLPNIDMLVMPKYAINSEQESIIKQYGVKLSGTFGIPHSSTLKKLRESFEQRKSTIPESKKYLLVVLGGDAPTPEGIIKYYTKDEAIYLAQIVASKAKEGYYVLVTNSGRTGLHNPFTKEKLAVHDESVVNEYKIDEITTAFCKKLEQNKVEFRLFDFKKLKTGQYDSSFDALLYTVSNNSESIAILPAESSSMITKTSDFLKADKLVVYNNNAVNQVHEAQVRLLNDSNRINYYEVTKNGFEKIKPRKNNNDQNIENEIIKSDAEIVAESVINQFVKEKSYITK
ncbi:MAG: hypothetical protein J0H68_00945 [Sphingobacteriia bacterium]|nr:hypothetical protein [Sphingobacteriia bacterium]